MTHPSPSNIQKCSELKALNFISLVVIVPVLSEKITPTHPNSSGIKLFLATA